MNFTMPLTVGIHHVGLTVQDLGQATAFFCNGLGWKQVGGRADYPAAFVSDGSMTLTLWQVADQATAVPFNRKDNVGLHHLALAVSDYAALDVAFDKVSQLDGVKIEFTPQPIQAGSSVRHFICLIPGGLRIEFATRPLAGR